jgi:hypothetical protein
MIRMEGRARSAAVAALARRRPFRPRIIETARVGIFETTQRSSLRSSKAATNLKKVLAMAERTDKRDGDFRKEDPTRRNKGVTGVTKKVKKSSCHGREN